MTDNAQDVAAGCGQALGCLVLVGIPGLIFFWIMLGPLVMGLVNSVVYPGYETCQTQIRKGLRDPRSAEFSSSPRRFDHRSDPDQWRYVFEVRAKNGFGGMNSSTMGCTVDDSGSSMQVFVEW
ncbi:MAG: hypothetical protein CML46_20020 [Rhodobacteraceae bacterium]|nr:hypothetical protein [Paracoccaceae bacterium]MBR29198.1 hypothetical protein [Paracoccaceae bacterium]